MSEFPQQEFDSTEALINYLKEHTDDYDALTIMVVNDFPMSGPRGESKLARNCCGIIKTCTGESKLVHREHLEELLNDGVLQRMRVPVSLLPQIDRGESDSPEEAGSPMIARPHDAHSVQHEFDFPPTILFPGTNDDPRLDTAERITLRDYYTACILPDVEGQLSDRSLASDRNALNHWEARTANPDIREISRDHLLQLCDSIDQDELSPKTRDKILRELNAMLFDACEEGYIHRVPAIPKRLKRRRRSAAVTIPRETVTMAEVESLWKACRHATYPAGGHYPAPRFWRVMIVLFYVYGQRTCDSESGSHAPSEEATDFDLLVSASSRLRVYPMADFHRLVFDRAPQPRAGGPGWTARQIVEFLDDLDRQVIDGVKKWEPGQVWWQLAKGEAGSRITMNPREEWVRARRNRDLQLQRERDARQAVEADLAKAAAAETRDRREAEFGATADAMDAADQVAIWKRHYPKFTPPQIPRDMLLILLEREAASDERPGLDDRESVLLYAIEPDAVAAVEWGELRKSDATDDQILATVAKFLEQQWPTQHAKADRGFACWEFEAGDGDPVVRGIWFNADEPPEREPDLEADHLVAAVRELYGIAQPAGSQPAGSKSTTGLTIVEVEPRAKTWQCRSCKASNPVVLPICDCGDDIVPGGDYDIANVIDALGSIEEVRKALKGMQHTGGSDTVIRQVIACAFRECPSHHHGKWGPQAVVWPTDLVSDNLGDGVWFVPSHEVIDGTTPRRKPDLTAKQLVSTVRRLWKIPKSGDTKSSTAKPPKAAKIPKAKAKIEPPVAALSSQPPALSPSAGVVPIDAIVVVDGANPRKRFDDDAMATLVESIKDVGILEPLLVRPIGVYGKRFELMGGERRLRAAKAAGLTEVPVHARKCDDRTAAKIRVIENLVREDLDAIDEAGSFAELIANHGYTTRTLAEELGVSQAKIANATRLLKLPDEWQQRVISREITQTLARDLATWAQRPAVLDAFAAEVENDFGGFADMMAEDFPYAIRRAVEEASRPLSGTFWKGGRYVEVRFTKKELAREDLDVVDVKDIGKRAFNVSLWEELQAAGEARRKKSSKSDSSCDNDATQPAGLTAEEQREKAKKQREQLQKKLYRWKIAWLQSLVVEKINEPEHADFELLTKFALYFALQDESSGRESELATAVKRAGGKIRRGSYGLDAWKTLDSVAIESGGFSSVLADVVAQWCAHPFEGYRADLQPEAIEGMAKDLGIDVETDWKLTREFLELHNKSQLAALAKEWKLELRGGKRGENIDNLLEDAAEKPCPKAIAKLKPVLLW
eukprot:g5263.t1